MLPVEGAGWSPGETVSIALAGPLNSPGAVQTIVALGRVSVGSQGAFSTSLAIPYDQGVTGVQARIPRPGLYAVRGMGSSSGTVTAAYRINLTPATYLGGSNRIDWSHERGTRDGVLPGPLHAYSPERSDPNWISVWDNRPVEIYGTVAEAGAGGANQPSRISFEDDPLTHYAHDANFYLLPDVDYRWTVGTANYFSNGEDEGGTALGRIEVEWEALNNGSPESYESGQIGLPAWAMPDSGDRMYVVGRWVLDAGHPELGDRTELHPPRLVAVMRERPAVSSGTAASLQVDIYVSGHGGAANHYPSGMDALLDQGGYGGGRLRDVLSAADQMTYYQPGPLPLVSSPVVALLAQALGGAPLSGPIFPSAGPSAFPWGSPAPEAQPINDRDYDFDVPLPPPPAGATSVKVEIVTHAQHSTSVAEVITYRSSGNGLPIARACSLAVSGRRQRHLRTDTEIQLEHGGCSPASLSGAAGQHYGEGPSGRMARVERRERAVELPLGRCARAPENYAGPVHRDLRSTCRCVSPSRGHPARSSSGLSRNLHRPAVWDPVWNVVVFGWNRAAGQMRTGEQR